MGAFMNGFKKCMYVIFFVFLLTFIGCSPSNKITKDARLEQERFDEFTNDLFVKLVSLDSLTLNYSLANPESYGISYFDPTLGEYSLDNMKKGLAISENYLGSLKNFDYSLLTNDQQITYDLIKSDLTLEINSGGLMLYTEILGPTTGLQAQLPILLSEYNLYDKEDIGTYIKLLDSIYEYFEDICAFERIKSKEGLFMTSTVAQSIIEQCQSFIANPEENLLIEYFNERMEAFEGLTEEEKLSFISQNEKAVLNSVIPAYELLIATLQELKDTGVNQGGLSNFEHGKEYYEYLVASSTGSAKTVDELSEMLEAKLNASLMDMTIIIQTDKDIINKLESLQYPYTDPVDILNYLKTAISKDFPELPDVKCNIKYVHESLQEYLSPAMFLVPPMDSYSDNNIYINADPSYDLSDLFPTIAHEGYPGHLYQSVYFRSTNPAPIRNILNYLGYDEGWATYVELYSYSLAGLDESVAALLEANMIATHCIYSRTDIGIHYDGWTKSDVENFLSMFLDESSIDIIYETLLEEPALYLPYSIGYLEIMELKNKAMNTLDDEFNLKEFHTFLLNVGPANFETIEKHFNIWLSNQK